jgi:hypothetical protein
LVLREQFTDFRHASEVAEARSVASRLGGYVLKGMRGPHTAVLTILALLLGGCTMAPKPTATFRSETALSEGFGPECHASNLVKLTDGQAR